MKTTTITPVVKQQVTKAVSAATAFVIKDEKDLEGAIDLLSKIKKVGKIIKEEKEKITKPLNEGLKATRILFAPYEKQWAEAEQIVKTKMLEYNQKVTAQRIKDEEKITAKVEAGKMSVEKAATKLEEVKEAPKSVEGKTGKISYKKVKKFEVVDLSVLPIEYHLANETKIRIDMFTGKELPGVRYYEEEVIASR